MAATAALSEMNMDIDQPQSTEQEEDLVDRLSQAHIGGEDELLLQKGERTADRTDNIIQMNTSDESTMETDDPPTPEGFFIDSKNPSHQTLNSQMLPQWSPPKAPRPQPTISSNPRPPLSSPPGHVRSISSSSPRPLLAIPKHDGHVRHQSHDRPLFVSSSSGALMPPPIEPPEERETFEERDNFEEDHLLNACPATRAAAAIRALETTNEHFALSEMDSDREGSVDISRQETFHTSHEKRLHELGGGDKEYTAPLHFGEYQSTTNEPIPPPKVDDDIIPSLYTFTPNCLVGSILTYLSRTFVPRHRQHTHGGSALAGFLALLLVTCANYMLGPMRDAAALAVGVSHIPALTLASTVLALGSSVPVGWLFEAPNPMRRRVWKRMGLTRGETQGTSLALFYRVFAFLLLSYAVGFKIVDKYGKRNGSGEDDVNDDEAAEDSALVLIGTFYLRLMEGVGIPVTKILSSLEQFADSLFGTQQSISSTGLHATLELFADESITAIFLRACACVVNKFGKIIYIMFFLVVHLMKLHSLSLIWGVTTEAMEYEENAERRRAAKEKESMSRTSSAGGLVMGFVKEESDGGGSSSSTHTPSNGTTKPSKASLRLKRLGFVGFGGTLGGILGGVIASFAAHILHLSGLLIVAAILLELSAHLSIELGRIMERHWREQMSSLSYDDLTSLASGENLAGQAVDSSMRKSISLGSMKRVASATSMSCGNLASMAKQQQSSGGKERPTASLPASKEGGMTRARSSITLSSEDMAKAFNAAAEKQQAEPDQQPTVDDNSFKQRLLRGITTILRSRLLMAIFTYNALYASTSVLLSFQRAELVANRSSSGSTSTVSNTAFLAKINTASSVAVFALQASGLGAYIANSCGQRGALALMPIIRLCGVILLGWWHFVSNGQPPDLILFLVIDEFTKVINFAIAKPVRENLWRGLSAEARYEAKPIVDTLANRWGGGSAAFLVSFINRITDLTELGVVTDKGKRNIFGFPPVLLLCMIISAWWTAVSADVGNIRRKIDLELKKQL